MSIFKWFSTDEIEFLVNTFNITLPKMDGTLSTINEVQQLREKLEQMKSTVQNYYTHPWLEGEQEKLKRVLQYYILDALESVDKFIIDLDSSGGQPKDAKKLQASLKKSYGKVQEAIVEAKAALTEQKKKHKALQDLRQQVINERNQFMTLLQDTKDIVVTISDVLNEEIPEPRKASAEALAQSLAKSPTLTEVEGEEKTRVILRENIPGLAETELNSLSSSISVQTTMLVLVKERLEEAHTAWTKELSDLIPSYDFPWENVKSTYKAYEELRNTLKNTNLLMQSEQQKQVGDLDKKYLEPFLKKEQETAIKGYKSCNQAWQEASTRLKGEREKALKALSDAENQMGKYLPVMSPDETAKINGILKESTLHLGAADFTNAIQQCTQLTNELKLLKARLTEYTTANQTWSQQNVYNLGVAMEETSRKILNLGMKAPHPNIDIKGPFYDFKQWVIGAKEFVLKMNKAEDFHKANEQFLVGSLNRFGENGTSLLTATEALRKKEKALKVNQSAKEDTENALKELNKSLAKEDANLQKLMQNAEKLKIKIETDSSGKGKLKKALKKTQDRIKESKKVKEDHEKKKETLEADVASLDSQKSSLENSVQEGKTDVADAQQVFSEQLLNTLNKKDKKAWEALVAEYDKTYKKKLEPINAVPVNDLKGSRLELELYVFGINKGDMDRLKKDWFTLITTGENSNQERYATDMKLQLSMGKVLIRKLNNIELSTETLERFNKTSQDNERLEVQQSTLKKLDKVERDHPTVKSLIDIVRQDIKKATSIDKINEVYEAFLEKKKKDLDPIKKQGKRMVKELFRVRDSIASELSIRKEIRKDLAKGVFFINTKSEKFIDAAYQNLESQLKNFTDAYLNSLQTDVAVLASTGGSLQKIQEGLDALDSSSSNDVVKQLRKLDSKIQAGIKRIKKASQLQSLMPNEFTTLQNEIEELKSGLNTQVPDTTKKRFAIWEVKFSSASIQSSLLDSDIKDLQAKSVKFSDELNKNESILSAYSKLYTKLKDGNKIVQERCNNKTEYDSAFVVFTDLQSLLAEVLANPEAGAKEENDLVLLEESEERQEQEWNTVFKEFKSRNYKALTKLIEKQKTNPELDASEKTRLNNEAKAAKKCIELAEKSGKHARYEEARAQLKEIRRIHTRLNRYPNGVNAHKLANLDKVSETWKASIQQFKKSINALVEIVKQDASGEGRFTNFEQSILSFTEQFTEADFAVVILRLKLKQGSPKSIAKIREQGMSLVRDKQSILKGSMSTQLQNNPILPMDFKELERRLASIEKTFLLFK